MNVIELPALDGRRVLGFLAALGALRILTLDGGLPDVLLSFNPATYAARLHSDQTGDIDDIVGRLRDALPAVDDDSYLDGVAAPLPLDAMYGPKEGPDDKMRMTPDALRKRYEQWAPDGSDPGRLDAWLSSLITDIVLEEPPKSKGAPLTRRTPLLAPFARQTTRSSFRYAISNCVGKRKLDHIKAALTGWRRVDGYTGEYFDDQAMLDSTDSPIANGAERGAPGATWLALMALPFFLTTGYVRRDGSIGLAATGWNRAPGSTQDAFAWPLWSEAIDLEAIAVLLSHPAVQVNYRRDSSWTLAGSRNVFAGLNIIRVCAADRQIIPQGTQRKRVFKSLAVEVAS